MIRRPPRSTQGVSSAASDVYKRQVQIHYPTLSRETAFFGPQDTEKGLDFLMQKLRDLALLQDFPEYCKDVNRYEDDERSFGVTVPGKNIPVSYTHLRAHETSLHLVCRLLLEKKKKKYPQQNKQLTPEADPPTYHR
eukprot:TRINITY_DN7007_c0_g1_i2.p2 TRINITY_DN7007_c0_g1~~TRINITY_DN7007_c0_g1_i2.p2  ORF type:complete len:137 (+),score=33.03 TRINITY_DN7007_c0_g1_i2:121-531(+)